MRIRSLIRSLKGVNMETNEIAFFIAGLLTGGCIGAMLGTIFGVFMMSLMSIAKSADRHIGYPDPTPYDLKGDGDV